MPKEKTLNTFLSHYNPEIYHHALRLREVIFLILPGVTEQLDHPAKMIAYCYGQKYIEMICSLIPSKKGLKLGFYKGVDLLDPGHLLEGRGKISRYIEIHSEEQIKSAAVRALLEEALAAYKKRMTDCF
jgi:hypothetical protein